MAERRMIGASEDDFRILKKKGFLINLNSGAAVVGVEHVGIS